MKQIQAKLDPARFARAHRSAIVNLSRVKLAMSLYHHVSSEDDVYLPARPTRDGRTVLALSPLESLAALSRLIPPPRVHRHRYHGVLAPNARLRQQVINLGRDGAVATGELANSAADNLPSRTGTATAGADPSVPPDSPQRAAARSR